MDRPLAFALVISVAVLWGAYDAIQSYGAYQGPHFDTLTFFLRLIGYGLVVILLDVIRITEKGSIQIGGTSGESILLKIKTPAGPVVFSACSFAALFLATQAIRTMSLSYVGLGALVLVSPLFLSAAASRSIPESYRESIRLAGVLLVVEVILLGVTLFSIFTR